MTKENTYSPFNQRELKIKVTLLNFLMVMKYLKEKGCIKKNGKFPLKEYRHGGRAGYNYYFGIALSRLLKETFGGKWQKQRQGFEYKSLAPFERLKYVDANDLASKMALLELRGQLNNYHYQNGNQDLRLYQRSDNRTYWHYRYNDQVGQNYSPIRFLEDQSRRIPLLSDEETQNIMTNSIQSIANNVLARFSSRDDIQVDALMNANNVSESMARLREREEVNGYSEESRNLLILTARNLMRDSAGISMPDIFRLAQTFLADNEDVQRITFDDVYDELNMVA